MMLSRKIAEVIVKNDISVDLLVAELRKYKLLSLLPQVKHHINEIAKTKHLLNSVHIESPFPLSSESIETILRFTGNKEVAYDVSINAQLLAGWKARYQGKLYDGSAERIIRQLTQ